MLFYCINFAADDKSFFQKIDLFDSCQKLCIRIVVPCCLLRNQETYIVFAVQPEMVHIRTDIEPIRTPNAALPMDMTIQIQHSRFAVDWSVYKVQFRIIYGDGIILFYIEKSVSYAEISEFFEIVLKTILHDSFFVVAHNEDDLGIDFLHEH